MSESKAVIENIIRTHLSVDEAEWDTLIANESDIYDAGADSLDTVEIIMALEEEFDCSIDESEVGEYLDSPLPKLVSVLEGLVE